MMRPFFLPRRTPSASHKRQQANRRKAFVTYWKPWDDVETAVLKVPEDHHHPSGRQIFLSYAKLKRKHKHAHTSPILILSGGPGIPALQGIPFWLSSKLRESHDLILFDQRGTDLSSSLPNIAPQFFEIMAQNITVAEESEKMRAVMADFLEQPILDGLNLSVYHPYQSVQDIEQLMLHLGYERYHLLGLSHGTKLASILMDRQANLVHRAVMYGPWTTCSRFFHHLPSNFSQAWEWYLQDCQLSPPYCSQSALAAALDQIKKEPITIEAKGKPFTINEQDVLYFLRYYLYFPNAPISIPAFLHALAVRDVKQLKQLAKRPLRMVSGEVNLTAYASSLAFDECEAHSAEEIDAKCKEDVFLHSGLAFFAPFARHLLTWQDAKVSAVQKTLRPNRIPSLIMVHEGDPVTPPWQGLRMQQTLRNSELMVFPECGHVYLEESKFKLIHSFFSEG